MDNDMATAPSVGSGSKPMYDMSKVNESSFKVSSALHLWCIMCVFIIFSLWLLT